MALIALPWAVAFLAAAPSGTQVGDTPFRRYLADGGKVVFYLSDVPAGQSLPIALFIQGTGCASHFTREDARVMSGLQSVLLGEGRGSVAVMVVEKPGVELFDDPANPGDANSCRPEYRQLYSLDTWCHTLVRAVRAARTIRGVDRSRMLVVGHSEGATIAVRLSNLTPGITHVAALAGGGPTFLFHISEFFRRKGLDPEKEVYPCWSEVLQDPASTTRFCWGQTFRQWSSFMKTSLIQEALASKSALYFGHGTNDDQNPVTAFDALRAELAARGRAAVFDRVAGGNHAFDVPKDSPAKRSAREESLNVLRAPGQPLRASQHPPEGLSLVFGRVLAWFTAE